MDLKPHSAVNHGWLRDLLLLMLSFSLPFMLFLGRIPLIDPDEGRYAEIPREMLERGDLITPTLNYVKYFEKPPLLYWLNAASIKIFGMNEFAARFPSALCGLLTVLVTYLVARKLYERRTALLAAFILGTSAGFVMQSRIILTDMLLTFCLTAALGAFIVAVQGAERRKDSLAWPLFYLFTALAVLTKGLIGMVFPGGIIFFWLLMSGEWRLLKRMHIFSGMLFFLAVAAPWFIAVSLKNPEFARFFFIHEHFQRFTSTVHGRYQPFWFFIPVLLGTMLPWSFFIPGSLSRAWKNRHHDGGSAGLFLFIWVILIFLFFSKSNSKLVPYILPIFPPLAILIAHRIENMLGGRARDLKPASLILAASLVLLGIGAVGYAQLSQATTLISGFFPGLTGPLTQFATHSPQIAPWVCFLIGALFLLEGCAVLFMAGKNPLPMVVVLCAVSFMLEIIIPWQIMGTIAATESPKDLAVKINSIAIAETRIVTFGPMQGISWYTGRRVMVTGNLDELAFGSRQGDQAAWFPDQKALLKLWGDSGHLLVLLKKNEYEALKSQLVPLPVLKGESGSYLIIANR